MRIVSLFCCVDEIVVKEFWEYLNFCEFGFGDCFGDWIEVEMEFKFFLEGSEFFNVFVVCVDWWGWVGKGG